MKKQTPTVYILHGYDASPTRHWFPWLRDRLESDGIRTAAIALPTPDAPRLSAWLATIAEAVTEITPQTYFVAHSLGCISLLQYLAEQPSTHAGGALLVSGFAETPQDFPFLAEFTAPPLDYAALKQILAHRTVLSAKDDPFVPHAVSKALADALAADFYLLPTGGHFIDQTGTRTLPAAYGALCSMLSD